MITITFSPMAYWLGHWTPTEEILGLNPFDCNYLVINFNEIINILFWKNSIVVHWASMS